VSLTEEVHLVVNADGMDDDIFIMHMNKRHRDSLGGLLRIWFTSEYMTECWRVFHDRLHQLRIGLGHEHGI
jgi:hypothetical protein